MPPTAEHPPRPSPLWTAIHGERPSGRKLYCWQKLHRRHHRYLILTITASGLASLGLKFGYGNDADLFLLWRPLYRLISVRIPSGHCRTMLGILVASIGMEYCRCAPL
ncbi:MAG: hypothetical protein ACLU38_02915 [Dysosmobacter sp.]